MKTAIVTGASRGIGAAIADSLLSQGWRVIGLCRSKPADSVEHVPCDFSRLDLIRGCVAGIDEVDLVVCAAGIGKFASAEGFSVQQIDRLMQVNFSAHAVLLGTLLPGMKKRRSGKIVIIGSEAALQGARLGSIYCATKFALRGYCQSLRAECRSAGIAVSMINPGLVQTGFHDNAHFKPGQDAVHALQVADVCQCVNLILDLPAAAVAEEINLQPMQPQVVKKKELA
jgi:short-subunit dehydrogenase